MNNIFKNAYFGKTYKTRDGRKAIYLGCRDSYHILSPQDYNGIIVYKENGFVCEGEEQELDIISEWQEPVDEEKLDKSAIDDILRVLNSDYFDGKISFNKVKEIYKAGYRKAKKQIIHETSII